MPLPLYLAMTAAELSKCTDPPDHLAYMACHFSPYTTGLSNLPVSLPAGSMLILNDRIPVHQHDPERILNQLAAFCKSAHPDRLLLDFQRPDESLTKQIVSILVNAGLCPTATTEHYAKQSNCSIFLSPLPYEPLSVAIDRWKGRSIWMDTAPCHCIVTVTEGGATVSNNTAQAFEFPFFHEKLAVHYKTVLAQDRVHFHLERTLEDLEVLLTQAENYGVECAVGLYQQLKKK